MKKMLLFSFILAFSFGSMSCDAQNKQKQERSEKAFSDKVEVIYFHYSRRCVTCNTVESEAKKHVEALYPELVKHGKITFSSINLEDAGSKTIAERCGVSGQSLVVVSGNQKADITQSGFMYARSQPERFKNEIKSAIDRMIK